MILFEGVGLVLFISSGKHVRLSTFVLPSVTSFPVGPIGAAWCWLRFPKSLVSIENKGETTDPFFI